MTSSRRALARCVWAGILFVTAWTGTGFAADIPCPRPTQVSFPAQVAFRVYDPRVVFRHDVDLLGLPRVEGHMEIPPQGWVLQGVTITNDHLDLKLKTFKQNLSDGRVCVWLIAVEATLGMPEQHVYVASDYPDYSCEYRSVLAHENRHVEINRRVVHSFADRMRKALEDGVAKTNPLVFSNRNVMDSQISGFLYSLMRPTLEAMNAELKRENGAIDTPAAYIKEHADSGCKNWFPHGVPAYAKRR
jgi:hypothetical protein